MLQSRKISLEMCSTTLSVLAKYMNVMLWKWKQIFRNKHLNCTIYINAVSLESCGSQQQELLCLLKLQTWEHWEGDQGSASGLAVFVCPALHPSPHHRRVRKLIFSSLRFYIVWHEFWWAFACMLCKQWNYLQRFSLLMSCGIEFLEFHGLHLHEFLTSNFPVISHLEHCFGKTRECDLCFLSPVAARVV